MQFLPYLIIHSFWAHLYTTHLNDYRLTVYVIMLIQPDAISARDSALYRALILTLQLTYKIQYSSPSFERPLLRKTASFKRPHFACIKNKLTSNGSPPLLEE